MLSILYLFTIVQLFTDSVALSDVKEILRSYEICKNLQAGCDLQDKRSMEKMADLVEITEDVFFPHFSVFSKQELMKRKMRGKRTNERKFIKYFGQLINSGKFEMFDRLKNERSSYFNQNAIDQFGKWIYDNIQDEYDDYKISQDKWDSKLKQAARNSENLVHKTISLLIIHAIPLLKHDDPVVPKLFNLCPLSRKNRGFSYRNFDVNSIGEPLSRTKRQPYNHDPHLYPDINKSCRSDTSTIKSECSYSNWMSMGISWELTYKSENIMGQLCRTVHLANNLHK